MSEEARTALVAALTTPLVLIGDRAITWARRRRKDDAEADLTVGQTWREIVEELRTDIADLRGRVGTLEADLQKERDETQRQKREITRYRGIIRSLTRHVLRLRDELAKTNTDVPPLPPDVEDAMTIVDLS